MKRGKMSTETAPKDQDLQTALSSLLAAPLQVQTQYIKDLSFENPRFLQVLSKGMTNSPQLAVNIEVQAQGIGENHYEVVLNTTIKALDPEQPSKEKGSKADSKEEVIFLLELAYGGIFSLPALPADVLKPFLLVECPRLLFPFVRSIIADVTKESGMPPVILAPVNFLELYEQGANASKGVQKGTA